MKEIFGTLSRLDGSFLVTPYEGRLLDQTDELKAADKERRRAKISHPEPIVLKPGDLVTIFKNVSAGEVFWSGTVKLEYERNYTSFPLNPSFGQQSIFGYWIHGLQEDMQPEEWGAMFFDSLPARLEKKDGTNVFGALDPFWETGTEGVLWSVSAYDKDGYDALNVLENGDHLTVYKNVKNGDILLQESFDNILKGADEKAIHHLTYYNFPAKVILKP